MTRSDRDRPAVQHDHTGHAFAKREPSPAPPMRLADAAELVLVAPAPRAARFDRDDLVIRKGQYALRNGHMTPQESMIEDLRAIGDVLDEAGIGYLLVRGNDDRLVIAVDRADRKAIARAFAEAFANEPFYSASLAPARAADAHPVLLADGHLSGHRKATVLRLYRPRVEPVGRLRYGRDTAVQLELWRFGEDVIEAPVENALMRRTLPRSEAIDDTVHLHGRDWPTLEHMFAPLASDVDFDIDMVFSWVDGSSDEFGASAPSACRATWSARATTPRPATARSTSSSTPCARCTCSRRGSGASSSRPTPPPRRGWRSIRRVTIVRSEEIFADTSVLPTHNSHAVESQLHHIPGIAEHFLYSNDDMFFGRPLSPSLFFSPGGITKFVEASTRIGLGETHAGRAASRTPPASTARCCASASARSPPGTSSTAPPRCGESVMADLETAFPEEFRAHGGEPLPLGHRHLGHELAVPLLRAAHRPRRGADRRPGQVRRDHAPKALPAMERAAQAARPGHVLPQRRQLPRDLGRAAHGGGHRLPRALLPVPGAVGEGDGCRGRPSAVAAADEPDLTA